MAASFRLRTSRPCVAEAEAQALRRVLESGYFGTGPETAAFEDDLRAYLGAEHVVCVATGTAALQLSLAAAGIGPGDEVLVPSLTFVATFQAVAATGARPVACDVLLRDGLLDPDDALRRSTSRTKAIVPVHYAGYAGALDSVRALARERGWRVVEDAAHAFGSRHAGLPIGATGDVVCFSFDPIKNITAGLGGAVVTRDGGLATKVRRARDLGIERDPGSADSEAFDVRGLGWRFGMSDLMAAIGRTQLARFDAEIKPRRLALAACYRARLGALGALTLLDSDPDTVPHIMPVRVPAPARDRVRAALAAQGYETRMHYKPNHLLSAFSDGQPRPNSERLYRELMTLPLHDAVTPDHVDAMVRVIECELGRAAPDGL